MDAISYTAVRANLSKTMEQVCNDHAPIIITRKRESPVVMLSLEDYQAMEETDIFTSFTSQCSKFT
jgi:antitoxin YefM